MGPWRPLRVHSRGHWASSGPVTGLGRRRASVPGNLEGQSSLHAGLAAAQGRIETWLNQQGVSAGFCSEGGGSRYARFTGYSISKVDSTPTVRQRYADMGVMETRSLPRGGSTNCVFWRGWICLEDPSQTCWSSSPAGACRDPPTARTSVSSPPCDGAEGAPSARYATCGRYSGSRGPARWEPSEPLRGVSGGGAASPAHGAWGRSRALSLLVEEPRRGVSRPAVLSGAGLQTRVLTVVDLDTPAVRATRSACAGRCCP
ncbi:hypothetical protein EDF35_2628 [Rathayibacter sp. PhB151]|nr:hypothetical protein EDF35_2628 [Rathayibacter sp. PhB151]